MNFNIGAFTKSLRDAMYDAFPNLKDRGRNPHTNSYKHGVYNEEIRDIAFKNNPIITVNENQTIFDIGNAQAEEHYPYYHILEDAPYIHKRDKSTSKSKGQREMVNREAREYLNYHYQYIEKMMDGILPSLASEYGLIQGRTQLLGLEHDLAEEWREDVSVVLNAFGLMK